MLNYRNGNNFDVAVASPTKRERSSVKTAHIRLRTDVFEEFAFDYDLTACILIWYVRKYIAQWEINKKRKHKRAKDHSYDTQLLTLWLA